MAQQLTIENIKQVITGILIDEPVYQAVLFGSYAKGEANSESDIDLMIDSHGELRGLKFFGVLEKITMSLNKKVDLIEFCEIERGSKIEKTICKEGIILYDTKN